MKKKLPKLIWIIGFALLLAILDLAINPIIRPTKPFYFMPLIDFSIIAAVGFLSLFIIERANTPFLLVKLSAPSSSRNNWHIIIALGLLIVIINTVVWFFSYQQYLQVPWINALTPLNAVVISLRAGIQEEILFRLFLFSLIFLLFKRVIGSQQWLFIVSAALSSLAFAILLHFGSPISLLAGFALAYIYYKIGLIPAMVVHFFGDCVPFVIVSLLN